MPVILVNRAVDKKKIRKMEAEEEGESKNFWEIIYALNNLMNGQSYSKRSFLILQKSLQKRSF
jgi:hypothetical protein